MNMSTFFFSTFRSIFEARWNDESRHFSRRAAALLVSVRKNQQNLSYKLIIVHKVCEEFGKQQAIIPLGS